MVGEHGRDAPEGEMPPALRAGANCLFRVPEFVPHVARFRRAVVQIEGTETGGLIAH